MRVASLVAAVLVVCVAACGGGGGSDDNASSTPPPPPPPATLANSLAVTVDAGPAALLASGFTSANTLFASITVCTPGSTTACRTVDHIQIDTGSVGLRIIASALSGPAVPVATADPVSGNPLRECAQFADGYSWGSVVAADVQLGGRTLPSLRFQLIGDPAAGNAPPSCVSGPSENTPATFGANGILGVGNFLQDCGSGCAIQVISGLYYVCPTVNAVRTCTSIVLPLSSQLQNPVSTLSADNNGVLIQLPSVPSPGAPSVNGTLYFGIGTQADNALGNARFYTLSGNGTFTATYNGIAQAGSFIDSGSNGYFFVSNTIAQCTDNAPFYCPVTSSGAPTSLTQTAMITGANGAVATVTFTVDNTDQLFTSSSNSAFPGLAGSSATSLGVTAGSFDFGLPFFYGRSVYVLFEQRTAGGTTGPAIAF